MSTNLDNNFQSGWVGGFNIGATAITDTGDSMGLSSLLTTADDVRFWAGGTYESRASAAFNVTRAGILSATGAIISGDITATTGTIGGFSVGSDYIRDAANTFGMASTVTGGDDVRFWAGATFANRATAPLRFTEGGTGVIAGFGIATDRISAGSSGGYIAIYDGTGPTGIQLGETSGINATFLSTSLTMFSAASTTACTMAGTGTLGFNVNTSTGAAYHANGTAGYSGTFDPNAITSITVVAGIITAVS